MTKNNRQIKMCNLGNCKNSVGLKPIAVRLSKPAESLVPTLCVGMHMGRSASPVLASRSLQHRGRRASRMHSHAERGNESACLTWRQWALALRCSCNYRDRTFLNDYNSFFYICDKTSLYPKTYDHLLKTSNRKSSTVYKTLYLLPYVEICLNKLNNTLVFRNRKF